MGLGGALLSAGGDMVGSAVSGAFNASQAGKARHWQEKMYNQRYQRTMADMKAAGLNPILAAEVGAGSAGGGASATMPDMGGAVSKGISTALAVKTANQELRLRETENKDKALDLGAKQRMYDWLEKNPQYRDMFLAGLMSRAAGLPSVAGPILGANSGWLKGKVTDAVDSARDFLFGKGADHRPPQKLPSRKGPIDDALRRTLDHERR